MTSESETRKEALERELREATAEATEVEESIREREQIRELERKIAFARNKARDLPHIQAAEDEHGEVRVVNTLDGAVVVKAPHHLAYNKFVRRMNNEKKPLDNNDYWRLVKPCIVYPEASKVEDLTEKYAGLTIQLGGKVVELGQGEAEDFEGK